VKQCLGDVNFIKSMKIVQRLCIILWRISHCKHGLSKTFKKKKNQRNQCLVMYIKHVCTPIKQIISID
jgi:hypothetical protein